MHERPSLASWCPSLQLHTYDPIALVQFWEHPWPSTHSFTSVDVTVLYDLAITCKHQSENAMSPWHLLYYTFTLHSILIEPIANPTVTVVWSIGIDTDLSTKVSTSWTLVNICDKLTVMTLYIGTNYLLVHTSTCKSITVELIAITAKALVWSWTVITQLFTVVSAIATLRIIYSIITNLRLNLKLL